MRLDDAVTFFLSEWPVCGPRRPSPETVRTYGWQLKWLVGFAAACGKVRLSDLTPELLKAAMAAKEAATVAHPPTHKGGEAAANSLACAARAMARWLLAQDVPVADLERVRMPRVPERIQPRVRETEYQAIQDAILRRLVSGQHPNARVSVVRDLALIHLLAETGLRAAEVCRMTLQSVDFDTGSVLVFRGKGSKPRALSVVDPEDPTGGGTLRLLREWIRERETVHGARGSEALWISSNKGRPLSPAMLRKALAQICADAGLDGNRPPHAWRRANFTENYLNDPANVAVLAARMGWSPKSPKMVDVYTRGAEIDFARTNPLPSLTSRWGRGGPKVLYGSARSGPMLARGVGPPWVFGDDAPPPRRVGKDGERAASQRTRGRRPYGTSRAVDRT